MAKRIQRKRTKGWRMPKGCVYVGRGSKWGNPFTIGCNAAGFSTLVPYCVPRNLDQVLADYRYYAQKWLEIYPDWLKPLRGKDLACWCPLVDKDGNHVTCHADVLLELANAKG